MCLFEYDEEKHIEGEKAYAEAKGRKEGEAKGREKGEAKGREETILKLVKDNIISIEEGTKQLGIPLEKLEKKLKALFGDR